MIVDATTPTAVQHFVLRWVEQSITRGNRGIGVSATSFGEDNAEEALRWEHRLLGRLPTDAPDLPDTSLCYLGYGPEVAVLHRIKTPDPTGRGSIVAHALVGSSRNLAALDALALHAAGWHVKLEELVAMSGWRCPPCEVADIRDRAGVERPVLEERSRQRALRYPLTRILMEIVDNQSQQFTVLGTSSTEPIDLLWGLHNLIGVVPRRQQGKMVTFSTFETTEKNAEARLVFLPRVKTSGYGPTRITVDLRETVDIEHRAPAIAALVDWYLTSGSDTVRHEIGCWQPEDRHQPERFWACVHHTVHPSATGQKRWKQPGELEPGQAGGEQDTAGREELEESAWKLADAERIAEEQRARADQADAKADAAQTAAAEAHQRYSDLVELVARDTTQAAEDVRVLLARSEAAEAKWDQLQRHLAGVYGRLDELEAAVRTSTQARDVGMMNHPADLGDLKFQFQQFAAIFRRYLSATTTEIEAAHSAEQMAHPPNASREPVSADHRSRFSPPQPEQSRPAGQAGAKLEVLLLFFAGVTMLILLFAWLGGAR